ncbi:Abi family protein, partial [Enterococcus faecalis]|nr:Abi family protein [Enterococcus faecalis]
MVLINNLTFGETSYFFNSLTNDLQEKIAKDFSVKYKKEYSTNDDISVGAL